MAKRTIALIAVITILLAGIIAGSQYAVVNKLNAKHETKVQTLNEQIDDLTAIAQKYTIEQTNKKFDTSALDSWCAGGEEGIIRMVTAVPYAREDGTLTLEDEQGELWLVEDMNISDDEYVLMWIADNNTKDNTTDDTVIKVFVEVHN